MIKKDGRREEFDREKLFSGIRKACEKRPLPTGTIEKVIENIESELYSLGKNEIATTIVGKIAMSKLADMDHIAYIRFASVYYEFSDLAVLKQAVDNLIASKQGAPLDGQLPLMKSVELINTRKRNKQRR